MHVQVVHKAYLRDMGRQSRTEADRLAEAAICFRMEGGLTASDNQDTHGGLMLKEWQRADVPKTDQLEALLTKQHGSGTAIFPSLF